MSKKIIFTVTNDLTYDQRMIRICSTLAGSGFEVELMGRKLERSLPFDPQPFKQTRLMCFFNKGKLFYLEYNIRLFFCLLFKRVDVISAVDLDTLIACTLVSKVRSKKLVFDAHEYFTEVPEVVNRPFIKKMWGLAGRLMVPHTDLAYTVNGSLAAEFGRIYKRSFNVIRNVPFYNPRPTVSPKRSYYILYQGDLNRGRGLEQVINAVKGLDIALHIAGDGPIRQELEQLVKQNRQEGQVKFLGYLKPEALVPVTADAWLGVNVLEPVGLSYYYSLANKFFNYIQAGVPQLCADFPEYRMINEQYEVAMLCDCREDVIREKIMALMTDPHHYKRMEAACVAAGKVFTWETEKEKLVHIYRSL